MKKRLISLLVALCMAVTLLPVSAITAWAEESGSTLKPLQIWSGYPVLDGITPTTDPDGHNIYTGDGWSYDGTDKVLTLAPESPTTYDLTDSGSIRQDQNSIACSAIITGKATIVNGNFYNSRNSNVKITNYGTITSGGYLMPVINHGTIIDGAFNSAVSNESDGKIENGTFLSTVTNNGIIEGGIFSKKPDGCKVADGYTLNVESPDANTNASISYLSSSSCYIIPNYSHPTSITVRYHNPYSVPPFSIDVTIDNTQQMLLTEWAGNIENFNDAGEFHVTFTAPPAKADTVTLSKLTRLVIDENGYPVGTEGGTRDYSGNGWKFEKGNSTLTLESGSYDFSGGRNALRPLNPDVNLVVEPGAKLTGGAAGDGSDVTWQLTENTDDPNTYTLTIRGSGAMKNFPFGSDQPWYSFKQQITSVVIHPGVTSIGECAFSWFPKLTHVDIADSVISIGGNAFKSCSSLTDITIPQRVTHIGGLAFSGCTSLSSITLSNNITSIGNAAFKNCTNLTSITIPSSVTSIGSNVFTGCTSLNDIRYSGTSECVAYF